MVLLKTLDKVEVKACCAPITSEFNLETRDPVCALVKKATDWRITLSKISDLKLKIRPSPIREENNLSAIEITAESNEIPATAIAP
jgi:hypothetical protein